MSAIKSKVFPTLAALRKNLKQELITIQNESNKIHGEKEMQQQKALLQYKKFNLIKQGKSGREIEEELKVLKSNSLQLDTLKDSTLLNGLVPEKTESPYVLNHISTVISFLKSKREHGDLLLRYNPGLSMEQEDRVRKTARRVGLEIPN